MSGTVDVVELASVDVAAVEDASVDVEGVEPDSVDVEGVEPDSVDVEGVEDAPSGAASVDVEGVEVAGVAVSLARAAGDVEMPIPTLSVNATMRPTSFLPCVRP